MPGLKIAQVSTTDMAMCVLLRDQIKSLQQQGHEVVAVCGSGPWLESLRKDGIPVEVVKMARALSPFHDLLSFCALVRCFRKHHFDVVHTHTPKAGLLGPMAARIAGVPVVVHTIHGLLFHDQMPTWKRWLFWLPEKITAAFSDVLLSQSKEDLAVAIKSGLCSTAKIKYLGNGIDVAKLSPCHSNGSRHSTRTEIGISDTDIVIGSVARLVYEKGFLELFAAAAELVEKHKSWKFVIVGPKEESRRDAVTADEIEALSRTGSVFFLNWRDDVSTWYAAMDIFVLPSHREGVPRTCMEAAAMELPVIVTDIRGCREVVKANETGILVPIKDSQALVAAIETLAGDEVRRAELGKEGRRHILANFNHELVLERLRNFYAQIQLNLQMNSKPRERRFQLRDDGIEISRKVADRLAESD
jgi:glycosyltransferase involved in cell wall biosynthesis